MDSAVLPFEHTPSILWRNFCDELYRRRFGDWLGEHRWQRVLKTDLYDEAVTAGLYPLLKPRTQTLYGIDILPAVVELAACRHPDLQAGVGDVRKLPFPDGFFGLVVSNSTLDHFKKSEDLLTSLRELYRVLEPEGVLLITLDNAAHPLVWLRRKMAQLLGSPLPLMPYYPGPTLNRGELSQQLRACGFELLKTGHWLHAPRVLAVQVCACLDRQPPSWGRRVCQMFAACEALEKLPTAFLTGHYVAAMARRGRSRNDDLASGSSVESLREYHSSSGARGANGIDASAGP